MWEQLGKIVRDTVDAMANVLKNTSFDPEFWSGSEETAEMVRQKYGQCFHILGLDVLWDADGAPWLLELNSAPSLDLSEVVPWTDAQQRQQQPQQQQQPLQQQGQSQEQSQQQQEQQQPQQRLHHHCSDDGKPPAAGMKATTAGPGTAMGEQSLGPKAGRVCRCGALPRPHEHRHSRIDLSVKLPVLTGAMTIVSRVRDGVPGGPAAWAEGTIYEAV